METNHPAADRDAVTFLLKFARALHAYGTAVHILEESCTRLAQRLGVKAQVLATPTSIMISVGPPEAERIHMIRTEPGDQDLGRLTGVSAVSRRVTAGELTPVQGAGLLDSIERAPARYGPALTTLAFGCSSLAASRFLGGNLREMVAAATIGLVVGLLAAIAGRSRALGRLFDPVAGFVASGVATAFAALLGPMSVYLATLAGIIILIPGFMLTVGMTELSSRHWVAGTARLAGAFVTFISIAVGVTIGGTLVGAILGAPQVAVPAPLPAWTEVAALVVSALSFTVLLRAEARDAVWILLAGAVSLAGNRLGGLALGPVLGVFIGSLIVGLASSAYARALHRPAAVTRVPGILLMVPGSVGFRSITSLLDNEVVPGVETAFRMILMATALAAGLLIADVISPARAED
jgi:uncharacterized membrane protein YjjP (DUF1212 family)